MNWPDGPNEWPLGDGRFATDRDQPSDREALIDCVNRRVAEGAALFPQGGRTALEYGSAPDRPGIALDVRGLNRVIDYPASDMTITIEAGATLSAIRATLEAEGQRLLIEAPDAERATIGAIFATDTTGPRRFGWGRPRDQILGISFVTSEGELVRGGGRVVKNVAGYDFPKLLTGSIGTLGTIVELTLKTRPKPETSALLWTGWDRLDRLDSVLEALNSSKARPIALELLNGAVAANVAQSTGKELPDSEYVLALGVEGSAEAVSWQLNALREELVSATDCLEVTGEEVPPLWEALTNSPATHSSVTFKAMMQPSSLATFVSKIDPGLWAVHCHAGNGVVWGMLRPEVEPETVSSSLRSFREDAVSSGGNLILARCPTAMKHELGVWGAKRGDWELARMIKRALDPTGTMNPGRFL